MDGHKCINACTRTGSSLWTAGSVCSVRSVCAFPPSRTIASCAVCVCTAPRAQTAFVYVPFCHSGTLLLRTHTKLSRLGPGSRLQNRGQVHWEIRENFRNAPDTCGHVLLSLLLIMFRHSRQGHRDIQCVQFHFFNFFFWQVTKTKLLLQSSQHAALTKPHFLLPHSRMSKGFFFKRSRFCPLNCNSL